MSSALDELVESLLYEGYALYPYTPAATKNATPTPFGIVYPPAYVSEHEAARDHLQLQCLLDGTAETELHAVVSFLHGSGERHEAVERHVEIGPSPLGSRSEEQRFDFDGLRGRVELAAAEAGDGRWRVTLRVENTTDAAPGLPRGDALARSLLSTHPLLRARGGTFVSPLEADGCENVNTWPVLATPEDDALLGAAIVLPDHPQIAPQSRGSLFDATEIEEALLLHVHALTDGEREAIADQDEAVSSMIERALATGPSDIFDLHAMMRPVDGEREPTRAESFDPQAGEDRATVAGVVYERGASVILRLGDRIDSYDRLLDGRTATVERIYVDLDDKVYLGVTIDSDPGQELMRETGRYHFFFTDEVELVEGDR